MTGYVIGLGLGLDCELLCWFGSLWILRVAYSDGRSYLYWPRDGYKSFKCLQTFLITLKCLIFSRVAYRFVWSVTPLSHTIILWCMQHALLSTVEHWPKFYGQCSTIFCKLEKFVLLHYQCLVLMHERFQMCSCTICSGTTCDFFSLRCNKLYSNLCTVVLTAVFIIMFSLGLPYVMGFFYYITGYGLVTYVMELDLGVWEEKYLRYRFSASGWKSPWVTDCCSRTF